MIIERDIYKKIKPHIESPEIIVVTGMRRTGKTTLLEYIYDKIKSSNKVIIDLENPLNQKYFEEEDFEKIKYNLEIKGLNFGKKAYLFLDEIQMMKNLPQIAKYLYDHYQIKFFLTGSSSYYLKNLFSESLSGRKYIFELFPLNFHEFLQLKDEKLTIPAKNKHIGKSIFDTFSRLYDEYLEFGGFPGVVAKDNFTEKKLTLDDIFSSYFQLEVIQPGDYRKTSVIRDLIILLMQRVGTKLDIAKISSELGVTRPTIYEYLNFLEGTYFIKLIYPYSKNKDVELRGTPKIYLCDSGLVNNSVKISEGSLFENGISQILRQRGEVNYYQKKNGAEIDFILDKKEAFEVKTHASIQDMKKLKKISKDLKLKKLHLISKNFSSVKNVTYGFNL